MLKTASLSFYILVFLVLCACTYIYVMFYINISRFNIEAGPLFSIEKAGLLLANDLTTCSNGVEPTCFGQNPSSPYTSIQFVPIPPGSSLPVQIKAGLFTLSSPMSVFVLSGMSPPPCVYWGFTLYLFNDPSKCPDTIFASIADTVNNISSGIGYNKPFTIVFGCNKAAIQQYIDTQATLGTVVSVPFPYPGSSANMLLVGRTAIFENNSDQVKYNISTNIVGKVLQYNRQDIPQFNVKQPSLKQRRSAVDELLNKTQYDAQADAFIQSVKAAVGSEYVNVQEVPVNLFLESIKYDNGYDCIKTCTNCLGDNRDAVYSLSEIPSSIQADKNLVAVFGVNHSSNGNAAYTNISVYNKENDTGLVSFDYYKDSPTYGLVVSKHELAIPQSLADSFVLPSSVNNIIVAERAYVQPNAGISAEPGLLYKPRVWILSK